MRFFFTILAALIFVGANAATVPHSSVASNETSPSVHKTTPAHGNASTPSTHDNELGIKVLELMVMQAEHIIHNAESEISQLEKTGHGLLVSTLKNEVSLAEHLLTQIRHDVSAQKHVEVHHLHHLEEMLLHVENRISEEILVIEEIKKHEEKSVHVETLIAQGEKLEKEAKEVLQKLKAHSSNKVADAIHNELHFLSELIHDLQKHPKGSQLIKEAAQLSKHEKTMKSLLKKAEELLHHPHHGY